MEQGNNGGQRVPRNIFEQLAFGLQTVNENIVDLYRMVEEIHTALYPKDFQENSGEPKAHGDTPAVME